CKVSDRFVNIIEHNKEEEIDPLEILTQNNLSVSQLSNKSKKSRVLWGEFLAEWKKKQIKEADVCLPQTSTLITTKPTLLVL
ncbi:20253_t:CDS:2, partial [Gigaspora rosea]